MLESGDDVPVPDLVERLQSAPELRLIGRRIRLRMDEYGYEGLVSFVTRTTVVLMECEKLTLDQQARRESASADHTDARDRPRRRRRTRFPQEAATAGDDQSPSHSTDVASAQTDVERLSTSSVDFEAVLQGNVGYSPFCTFVRRRIHDVRLIDNKEYEPSTKRPGDQMLRAHIRRFIIHSALGNTAGVSLSLFIAKRTGWAEVDETTIQTLLCQEQASVEALATEVSKARLEAMRQAQQARDTDAPDHRLNATRRSGQEENLTDLADEDAARLPFVIIGLNNKTMYCAIFHLVMSIIVLLYAASVFSTSETAVVSPFVSTFSAWVAGAATVQLVEAALVGMHSLRMRHPIPCKLMTVRLVVLAAALTVLAIAVYATSSAAFTFVQPISKRTAQAEYVRQVREAPQSICTYSVKNRCGGWNRQCNSAAWDAQYCPSSCSSAVNLRGATCASAFQTDIQNVAIPVCVFQYLSCIVFVADIVLLLRYLYVAKHPEETIAAAQLRAPPA
jgi:hypothetical protein